MSRLLSCRLLDTSRAVWRRRLRLVSVGGPRHAHAPGRVIVARRRASEGDSAWAVASGKTNTKIGTFSNVAIIHCSK